MPPPLHAIDVPPAALRAVAVQHSHPERRFVRTVPRSKIGMSARVCRQRTAFVADAVLDPYKKVLDGMPMR
jgi:hypothetical protein